MSYFEKKSQVEDGIGNPITSTPEAGEQALDVHVSNTSPIPVVVSEIIGAPVNVFGEIDAAYAVETTIVSYTVPVGKILSMTTGIGWGNYDGEFLVRVDGVLKGGGRSSAAQRNWIGDYTDAPITAVSGQVVTITITHYSMATQHFRSNLLGGLN